MEKIQNLALEKHNQLRLSHCNTPALQLDQELCDEAMVYANHLAEINTVKLLSGTSAGENIYSCPRQSPIEAINSAISQWYSQEKNYSYETGRSTNCTAIGNFTQLIWNKTRKLGIGYATSGSTTFVVARYLPAGNTIGEYQTNVLPTKTDNQPKLRKKINGWAVLDHQIVCN